MNNTNTLGKFRILSVRADGKVEHEQNLDFRNQRGDQPLRIPTAKGLRYRLIDVSKQGDAGPDEVQVKRVGKDLHIALDDGGQTDVILENYYYNATRTEDGLYGLAQDGESYSYVPQDPQENGLIDVLANEGEWVEAALGTYQVIGAGTGAGAAVAVLAFNPLLAAAGAGVAAAAAGGGGGGGNNAGGGVVPDTTPPATPTMAVANDDVGSITGAMADGSSTDDTKPSFSGTGNAGELIKIYDGAAVIGSVTVGADGKWSFTPVSALNEGSHSITTTATDAAGNESAKGPALVMTVDTTAPSTPAAPVAGDDVGTVTGAITGSGVTDDTKPSFSGTGNAGELIKIYDGAAVIGSVTVGANGTWTFTPAAALTEGAHSIATTATDSAGNESAKSPAKTLTVDTTAPATPAMVVATDDVGATQGAVSSGSATDDIKPAFSGAGTAGDLIKIYDGATLVGSTTVAANGTWSYTPAVSLGDGTHSITVTATDLAGNESKASLPLTLTVQDVLAFSIPAAPGGVSAAEVEAGVAVKVNLPQGAFAGDQLKLEFVRPNGTTFTITRSVTDAEYLSKQVDVTLNKTLLAADGMYSVLAKLAGTVTKTSESQTFMVDTKATNNSTVGLGVSPLDDANGDGWVNAAELQSHPKLTTQARFNANAVAGDKIEFTAFNNGVPLDKVLVVLTAQDIQNGYVSASFAKPAEGTIQKVLACYVDAAGNAATDSQPFAETRLDTVAPGAAIVHGLKLSTDYTASDVNMHVALPSNATVGDKITVTMTNTDIATGAKSTPFTIDLTVKAEDLVAGKMGFVVKGQYFSRLETSTFTAIMVDAAGNATAPIHAAPAAPVVVAALVDDDSTAFAEINAQIYSDADRAKISNTFGEYDYATIDQTLRLQGSANPNDSIILYDNGVELGRASFGQEVANGLRLWKFDGQFAVGNHVITARAANPEGLLSDASTVFTFKVQASLDLSEALIQSGRFTAGENDQPERMKLMTQDVLNLGKVGKVLNVTGDMADTLVVAGLADIHEELQRDFFDAQQGELNNYVQHIQGSNGQAGSWQFDLDRSGSMDLVVSDAIHRIILSV